MAKSKKEKISPEEELNILKENINVNYYDGIEGVKELGHDDKTLFFLNPDNNRLVQEACENSGLDIELKAYSDVIVLDCFYKKAKDFVAQIKKVAGKDLTNPLFKDKQLIIIVKGDRYYGLKEPMKKYYLLKELSRVLYSYEKDTYKILKYDYQNNWILLNKYGLNPAEVDL